MGYLYEELVRKFSELSNETAGEHFTPREVIRLMVDLLFIEDDEALRTPGIVRTLLDPACGTGGMLSVAQEYLRELNPGARLEAYGQELNAETYAICRSDMMLKGQKASNIRLGNSFSEDHFKGQRYDYLLANPPFGVEWKKVQGEIEDEHDKLGFAGRFGAGLPRINDGSFLFLQHMISKLKRPEDGGGRLAIVFNGSPLFTGGAGSGESEIRRWIIENDWLEGIVALPDQLFYNTGISTYFWIVTNRKRPERRGKVQLVDARELFTKMRKSLGNKRNEIGADQIAEITRLYGAFEENERVKILPNESFGFQRITVERPLRLRRYEVTEATLRGGRDLGRLDQARRAERLALADRLTALTGLVVDRPSRGRPTARARSRRSSTRPSGTRSRSATPTARSSPTARDIPSRTRTSATTRTSRCRGRSGGTTRTRPSDSPRRRTAPPSMPTWRAEVLPFVPDAWVDHAKTKDRLRDPAHPPVLPLRAALVR